MTPIYHLVHRSVWERSPQVPYQAASLATEGFIHCSRAEQVAWAANNFYQDAADLLVLEIDPQRLGSEVRTEQAKHGEWFPHIYGPIERTAVVQAHVMSRGADGRWQFGA